MFITTQQVFFIRTRPHRVCHPHHKVFSSAPMRIIARVEYNGLDVSSHNSPAERAKELFKPSKKAESLLD